MPGTCSVCCTGRPDPEGAGAGEQPPHGPQTSWRVTDRHRGVPAGLRPGAAGTAAPAPGAVLVLTPAAPAGAFLAGSALPRAPGGRPASQVWLRFT